MKNRLRIIYGAIFIVVFALEVCIALFIRDDFIRPYVGDALVTVLICSFVRIIIPEKVRLLPLWVFLFAAAVEIGQYFDFVALLGLDGSAFFSTLLGRTFSLTDIVCYAVGCVVFALAELLILRRTRTSEK